MIGFFKRLLISPLILVLVIFSVLFWVMDLLKYIFTGVYTSDLREGWECSQLVSTLFDPLFDWSNE